MQKNARVIQDLHNLGYSIAALARWSGTDAETLRRRISLRRSGRVGLRVTGTRLTEQIVLRLRASAGAGVSIAELANEIGVDRSTVFCAIVGRSWRHLPNAIRPSGHGGKRRNAGRRPKK